jgi:hypothetical protein
MVIKSQAETEKKETWKMELKATRPSGQQIDSAVRFYFDSKFLKALF